MYYEHVKGLESERRVIEHLKKQNWLLVHHRFKTRLAEVDLIFQKNDQIRIIEVKSISSWDFIAYRISKKQKQRLIRVYDFFQRHFQHEILLELALVPVDGDILFIEIENFSFHADF